MRYTLESFETSLKQKSFLMRWIWWQALFHMFSQKTWVAELTKWYIGHLLNTCFGWLYTFHISYFASISQMFLQNTLWNMKHSIYTCRISCEFRVLLMSHKNKPQNPLIFRAHAKPGAKCEKQKKGCETRKKLHKKPRYTVFVFHISQCFSHISW